MDKDYKELVEFIGEKFDRVDEKFDKIDERFDEIDERFDKIDERFFAVDEKLENLMENKADKADMEMLRTSVDAYAKKADTYFQEMVMLSHKVDRQEKWIHFLADKLGVKLEY